MFHASPDRVVNHRVGTRLITGSTDVRAIGVDGDNRLWVSRRSIAAGTGIASPQGVDVFNIGTNPPVQIGTTLTSTVPVTSIAFGNL